MFNVNEVNTKDVCFNHQFPVIHPQCSPNTPSVAAHFFFLLRPNKSIEGLLVVPETRAMSMDKSKYTNRTKFVENLNDSISGIQS